MKHDFFTVLREAHEAGAPINASHPSGIVQIDGHAWNRWADLRHQPDPVIVRLRPHAAGSVVTTR